MRWIVTAALLAGCSSQAAGGEGGGAGGSPGDGDGEGGGSGGAAPVTTSASGPDVSQFLADQAIERLSRDTDNLAQLAEDPSVEGRTLRGCRVDAPGLGEDVVYVESFGMGSASGATQLVLAIEPSENALGYVTAARAFLPVDLAAARQLCDDVAPGLAAEDVTPLAICDTDLSFNDVNGDIDTAVCVWSDVPGAKDGVAQLRLLHDSIRWVQYGAGGPPELDLDLRPIATTTIPGCPPPLGDATGEDAAARLEGRLCAADVTCDAVGAASTCEVECIDGRFVTGACLDAPM